METARVDVGTGGQARSSDRFSPAKLVGRERELETLLDAVCHPPALVFIEGEAGVGKSRLVEELGTAMEGQPAELRMGRCHPQPHPFPLGPVVDALRDASPQLRGARLGPVAGRLRRLLPELAEVLPPPPGPSENARAETHQIFRGLHEVLTALGPTVLVLEDLHWADDTTEEFLHFLAGSLPDELSLVLTYRGEHLPDSSTLRSLSSGLPRRAAKVRIELEPLDAQGVATLVAGILGLEEVSPGFTQYLYERTAGLPFAVEEVLHLLRQRQDLVQRDGRWARRELDRIEVPGAVRDAVVERLAHLSPPARRLAWATAVLGRPAGEEALGQTAGIDADELPEILSEALQLAVLREVGEAKFGFRHDLARAAVYDAVPAPQRRQLHLRAAELLEGDPAAPAAEVAHHYREAGNVADWASNARRAVDEAFHRLDELTACRILADLVVAAPFPLQDRVRLAMNLGRAALGCGAQREAATVLRQLLQEEGLTREMRGELRSSLAHALIRDGEMAAGMEELRRCVPDLAHNPPLAALAMSSLGQPVLPDAPADEELGWMERALGAAARLGDGPVKRVVMGDRAAGLLAIGHPEARAAVEAIQALPVNSPWDRLHQARWFISIAKYAVLTAHYELTEELLAAVTKQAGDAEGSSPTDLIVGAIQLFLDWSAGRWQGLDERARALLRDAEATLHHPVLAMVPLSLYQLAREGLGKEAEQGLVKAMELSLRTGLLPPLVTAAAGLARGRLESRSPAEALAGATETLEMLRRKGTWVWGMELVPVAGECLLRLGRRDEAGALVDEFAEGLVGRDAPAAGAALALCRGLLEESDGLLEEAGASFEAAASAWAALPRPYDAALASERSGRALFDVDRGRAEERLVSALELETMGATWEAARIRRYLRRRGVRLPYPWRGGRRRLGDALSPREAEILALAGQGLTMREIGDRLCLSPRTVESHLARARRKEEARQA